MITYLSILEPVILMITGIGVIILQMIYFIIDDRQLNHTDQDKRVKKIWHVAGGLIHVWMAYVIYRLFNISWGLLTGISTWFFMDGFINSYALYREWFYVGNTAYLDRSVRYIAKILSIDPRIFSGIVKCIFLTLAILFVIFKTIQNG